MMKVKRSGGKIGFSKWGLDALDEIESALKGLIARAIDEAFELTLPEDSETTIGHDGDTLRIFLPLGEHSDNLDGPEFRVSLTGIVEEELGFVDWSGHPEDYRSVLELRDNLRALADKIDSHRAACA